MKSVAWRGLGALVTTVGLAAAIVACNGGGEGGGGSGGGGAAGDSGVPPITTTSTNTADAGGLVLPSPAPSDAGAAKHPPPPAANDAGIQQTDGGTHPIADAGSTTTSPSADDASTQASNGDDAGDPTNGSSSGGSSGGTSSAQCVTGADCFSVPCPCTDGTVEFWQACGADGICLGYGVCLNDQVCANGGGLYDPTAPPATCDSSDPSGCAPVTCDCNDGTVLDYQACQGTACATIASCSADADDVCSAHGGWIGDAPTPSPTPCQPVLCACPDGVTYTIPDEQCLGSAACGTDLVCSGD